MQERRKTFGVKRKNELKKTKSRKKERLEGEEGSTFESRIGETEEAKPVTKGIIDVSLETCLKKNWKGSPNILLTKHQKTRKDLNRTTH